MSTKNEIEKAAITLFSLKGIKATTIRNIASAVSLTEGALYKHYSSKEELARSVFEDRYHHIIDDLKRIAGEYQSLDRIIEEVVAYYCNSFDNEPEIFKYLLISDHYQYNLVPRMTLMQFIRSLLDEHKISGDTVFISNMLLGIVIETGRNLLNGNLEGTMSDYQTKILSSCMMIINNSNRFK